MKEISIMEIWKDIPMTNGKILISNMGRIKSNLRDGRILKTQRDKKGYETVRVTIDRKKLAFKVHREVAKIFNLNPEGYPQVNHKDGNKLNNKHTNLEWVTNIENAHHAISNNLWVNVFNASREANERKKKPVVAINASTNQVIRFDSVSSAERYFNTRHVVDVIKGKRNHAQGQIFKYAQQGGWLSE